MKFSSILPAAAFAAALTVAGAAQADDTVTNVNLGGNGNGTLSASFGVTHLATGHFIDIFNFSPTNGSWFVDSSLVQIGFQPSSNIDFHSAAINGHAMTLSPTGVFEYGWMINEPILGPLILTVDGTVTGLGSGASASFAGTINISPIPEPETYGMLLGGLGILAWASRRKFQFALKSA